MLLDAKDGEVKFPQRPISKSVSEAGAEATITKPGALTLPAKKLYEINEVFCQTPTVCIAEDRRCEGGGRPLRLAHADAAEGRLPDTLTWTAPARRRRRCHQHR